MSGTKVFKRFFPSKRVVWSVSSVDLSDSFQRRWYIKQVLEHGGVEDIRFLIKEIGLKKIAEELDNLNLSPPIYKVWKILLENIDVKG